MKREEVIQGQKSSKKNTKSKQTILLIAIKNNEVYSYVREHKLGKILGLNSKYVPRAISKTWYDFLNASKYYFSLTLLTSYKTTEKYYKNTHKMLILSNL